MGQQELLGRQSSNFGVRLEFIWAGFDLIWAGFDFIWAGFEFIWADNR